MSLITIYKITDSIIISRKRVNVMVVDKFDGKLFGSCHINLFFGAGVNGKAFPQLSQFTETCKALEKELGRKVENYESDLNELSSAKIKTINKKFRNEFEKFSKEIDRNHNDILDIEDLFIKVNKLVVETENRTLTSKQVNVYTLNYDDIVEKVVEKIGLLNNVVSSSNISNHNKFFNLVGYDYGLKRYIPTYLISKIHGDITNPILPGANKYEEVLAANKFEILFKMKSQLSRINSILIVIGYSGKDEHINKLLSDCVTSGLTVFWFKYKESDYVPETLIEKIFIIEQKDQSNRINTTKICSEMIGELWDMKLE